MKYPLFAISLCLFGCLDTASKKANRKLESTNVYHEVNTIDSSLIRIKTTWMTFPANDHLLYLGKYFPDSVIWYATNKTALSKIAEIYFREYSTGIANFYLLNDKTIFCRLTQHYYLRDNRTGDVVDATKYSYCDTLELHYCDGVIRILKKIDNMGTFSDTIRMLPDLRTRFASYSKFSNDTLIANP